MTSEENEQDAGLEIPAVPDEGHGEDDEQQFVAPEPIEGRDDDEVFDDEEARARAAEAASVSDQVTPEQLEQRAKRTETSFKTYTRAVERNYETDMQYLMQCPLCPDQHKGFVDLRSAGYVPDEVQDAVKLYFGIAREQDYAPSPHLHMCEACEGKTKVKTGSTDPQFATIKCEDCQGRGYIDDRGPVAAVTQILTGPTVHGTEPVATQAFDDVDEWDEPRILPDGRENPNFGKMPNRKIPVEPWGVTAGLNALSA